MSYDMFPLSAEFDEKNFRTNVLDSMGQPEFVIPGPRDWGERIVSDLNACEHMRKFGKSLEDEKKPPIVLPPMADERPAVKPLPAIPQENQKGPWTGQARTHDLHGLYGDLCYNDAAVMRITFHRSPGLTITKDMRKGMLEHVVTCLNAMELAQIERLKDQGVQTDATSMAQIKAEPLIVDDVMPRSGYRQVVPGTFKAIEPNKE